MTAQKRAESVQDVPISIQAFTGDQLKDQGINQITEIVQLSPNLNISGQSATNRQINIRGVGTSDFFPNGTGSVGIYMDEVTMSAPYLTSLGLHDIERVEILRGPQNSLFGRNTTGGAVNFISVLPEPGQDVEGFLDATVGNFEHIEVDGAISFPLGENVAARIAARSYNRDGIWKNQGENGRDFGEKDKKSYRATLVWDAASETSLVFNLRYAKEDSDLDPIKAVGLRGPNGTAWNTNAPFSGPPTANPNVPTTDVDFSRSHDSFNAQGDNPSLAGWENVYVTGTHRDDVETTGGYIKLSHEFDFATFTSITSFDDTEIFWSYDTGGIGNSTPTTVSQLAESLGLNSGAAPQADLAIDMDLAWKGLSQELRLASGAEGRLRWIAGFYYFYEESDLMSSIRFGEFIGPPNVGDLFGGAFFGRALLGDPTGYGNKLSFQYAETENTLWSPYLNLDYDITDDLSVNLGLRYTDDRKKITDNIVGNVSTLGDDLGATAYTTDLLLSRSQGSQVCTGNSTQICRENISGQRQDNLTEEFGGKLGLNYRLNDNVLIYGHYSRGFRGGKHDIEFLHGPQSGWSLVDPGTETLDAFEVGFKSDLLDGKLQLNAATFLYYWNDQQAIFVNPAIGPQVLNIPESELFGLEIEMKWAPADGWYLQAALGLQDTEITTESGTGLDAQGHELPFAAPTSANLLILREFEIGDNLLGLQLDWAYRSAAKAYARDQAYVDELEETSKLNARVSYTFGAEEQFGVSLWGENLTEEQSCLYKWNLLAQAGTAYCITNEAEAFYGVTASFQF